LFLSCASESLASLIGFLFRRSKPFIGKHRGLPFIEVGFILVKGAEMFPLSRLLISR